MVYNVMTQIQQLFEMGIENVLLILIIVFFALVGIIKAIKDFLSTTNITTRGRIDAQRQSEMVQSHDEQLAEMKDILRILEEKIDTVGKDVNVMKEENNETKINELRERLLQGYRYYTSLETRPDETWNEMESDAFWQLFKDYERRGGDGYMHTVVEPSMSKLIVTPLNIPQDTE